MFPETFSTAQVASSREKKKKKKKKKEKEERKKLNDRFRENRIPRRHETKSSAS